MAGFWRRAAAAAIDGAVLLATLGNVGIVIALVTGARVPNLREIGVDYLVELALGGKPVVLLGLGLAAAVGGLYFLLFHAMSGQTIGKRAVRIRVISTYGRSIGLRGAAIRLGGCALGALMLSLGFVWIAFDREKRGLHDWLAGSYVVRA